MIDKPEESCRVLDAMGCLKPKTVLDGCMQCVHDWVLAIDFLCIAAACRACSGCSAVFLQTIDDMARIGLLTSFSSVANGMCCGDAIAVMM